MTIIFAFGPSCGGAAAVQGSGVYRKDYTQKMLPIFRIFVTNMCDFKGFQFLNVLFYLRCIAS